MNALLIIIATVLFIPQSMNSLSSGYDVNDAAIDFNLKNVDGNYISLSGYKEAKGFIISFTCNECPYSQMYEKRIIELDDEFASKGFPVIAINPNDPVKQPGDSFEEMVKRSKEKKYPFPYLVDEKQNVSKAFGATNTPHMFVLLKENSKYIVKYIGTIDNNPKSPEKATKHYVKEAVNALLDGKEVFEPKTKAIGCSIKWK